MGQEYREFIHDLLLPYNVPESGVRFGLVSLVILKGNSGILVRGNVRICMWRLGVELKACISC